MQVTRVRPLISMPLASSSAISFGVSGISPMVSRAIISTAVAPDFFAVMAQSAATAPPPTTATRPTNLCRPGFHK